MAAPTRTTIALLAVAGVAGAACAGTIATPDEAAQPTVPAIFRTSDDGADGDVFVDRRSTTAPIGTAGDGEAPADPPRTTVEARRPATTSPEPVVSPSEPPADDPFEAGDALADESTGAAPAAGPATTSPAAAPVPSWPPYVVKPAVRGAGALTGAPVADSAETGPVLVVKVDNVGSARPQWSLDRADVIFEENVESATRFLALFHSDVPAEVGPVRSARTTDLDLLAAMNRPVLAWSGGNAGVTSWVRAAADAGLLEDVAAVRSSCYRRESSRRAPHNLVAATGCVLDRGAGAGPARPLWAFDADWTIPASATPDTTFDVAMDGPSVGWTWDPANGVYVRSQGGSPHVAASGTRLAVDNVVVLAVEHRPSPVDARSPHAVTVGSGPAVVHRDGRAIHGTWSRATAYDRFEFRTADGRSIPLQLGRTFVELTRVG